MQYSPYDVVYVKVLYQVPVILCARLHSTHKRVDIDSP